MPSLVKQRRVVALMEASDGVRTRFTLAVSADLDGGLLTFRNGQAQAGTEATFFSASQIDFLVAPIAGQLLHALILPL